MELMNLPAEILHEIVQYLGPAFRADIGLTSLCRRWHHIAQPLLFGVSAASPMLVDLARIPWLIKTVRSIKPEFLDLIHSQTKSIAFEFDVYDNRAPGLPHTFKPSIKPTITALGQVMTYVLAVPRMGMGTPLRALHTLSIATRVEVGGTYDSLDTRNESYMRLISIRNLIQSVADAAPHLTVLEIDTQTIKLRGWGAEISRQEPHLCAHVAALLPRLKRLRVRQQFICADVLQLPASFLEGESKKTIPLQELIVNMCCSRRHENPRCRLLLSHHCKMQQAGKLAAMTAAMRRIKARMEAPRMIRLLWPPDNEVRRARVWDGLEEKIIGEVDVDGPWDAKVEALRQT
ncbi:hypothetical protein B0H63DRAFT_197717 [Podospora didyma]|uniref:F-box domain-containing protein n=1 Tax=Podospora didyma TaxID=330526 RepID=A0AAE0NGT8_9PEZI|nr:hypothetical protein B0H63DRAFT_197717 [Podospora didyma]